MEDTTPLKMEDQANKNISPDDDESVTTKENDPNVTEKSTLRKGQPNRPKSEYLNWKKLGQKQPSVSFVSELDEKESNKNNEDSGNG